MRASILEPAAKAPLRAFVQWNAKAARALDRAIAAPDWLVSAGGDFSGRVVPSLLRPGMRIWDVGCGSRPMIGRETRSRLRLHVTGVDVDADELALMEPGACDQKIRADVGDYRGTGEADLVICRTVLEHVPDVDRAFEGLVSILAPGATLAVMMPCRNAPFARINLLLPERVKHRLLYAIWPHKDDGHSGFPARYNGCTPSHFLALAARHGLEVRELRPYWWSSYFTFLLPLWALWRLWQACGRMLVGDDACEGFVLVATRP